MIMTKEITNEKKTIEPLLHRFFKTVTTCTDYHGHNMYRPTSCIINPSFIMCNVSFILTKINVYIGHADYINIIKRNKKIVYFITSNFRTVTHQL